MTGISIADLHILYFNKYAKSRFQ